MANTISIQFNNQITSIQELRDYLTKRIAHIRSRDGKLTRIEEECQTILDMLPEEE